eukprot:m.137388 g.137388  ORF g.137388 m.137388 type:complete len:419 (+) comp11646_c0_seq1:62-1318(+)
MNETHPLVLRVMHLSRPNLATVNPSSVEHNFTSVVDTLDGEDPEFLSNCVLSDCLVLPSSMGEIYLGEKFSCLLNVSNEGKDKVSNVAIKAEMQLGSQKENLLHEAQIFDAVGPSDSVQAAIDHEIQSMASRILVCSVYYTTPFGDRRSFRKFFQFKVSEPLEVRPSQYTVNNSVIVQVQLTNLMKGAVHFQLVQFIPHPKFVCTDLNFRLYENNKKRSLFLDHPSIAPKDARLFMFKLTPSADLSPASFRRLSELGRFDIVWRSAMGAVGRLQTNTIERKLSTPPSLELRVVDCPHVVYVGEIFSVKCELHNNAATPIDTLLYFDPKKSASCGIFPNEFIKISMGKIESCASQTVDLKFVATRCGHLQCQCVHLVDVNKPTHIPQLFDILAQTPQKRNEEDVGMNDRDGSGIASDTK